MELPVSLDIETLIGYRETFEQRHQGIEHLAISLEDNPHDLTPLPTLRSELKELWVGSTQLSLAPISENVEILVQAFDFMIEHNAYPPAFSEYLLLLMDRLLAIARHVENHRSIDLERAQRIHVSLQYVILCKSIEELAERIPSAIAQVACEIPEVGNANAKQSDVVLFDDTESAPEIFDDKPSGAEIETVELFIPTGSVDPFTEALDFIRSREEDPLSLLGELSDRQSRHGTRHTLFLQELALAMNIMEGEPITHEALWAGICLHDIGLAHLSDILEKPGKLTSEERDLIRQHPIKGAAFADKIAYSPECKHVVLEHHERLDGRGYPFGLRGNEISDGGKIVAIVDSFHAMIATRPHKRHNKHLLRAVSEINACAETHYDPRWVNVFNQCLKKYWLPKKTQLTSTEEEGVRFGNTHKWTE